MERDRTVLALTQHAPDNFRRTPKFRRDRRTDGCIEIILGHIHNPAFPADAQRDRPGYPLGPFFPEAPDVVFARRPGFLDTDVGYDIVSTRRALERSEVKRFADWITDEAETYNTPRVDVPAWV